MMLPSIIQLATSRNLREITQGFSHEVICDTCLKNVEQAQTIAEKGVFTVSVNFYVLPLDFFIMLGTVFLHILIVLIFVCVVLTDIMLYPGTKIT